MNIELDPNIFYPDTEATLILINKGVEYNAEGMDESKYNSLIQDPNTTLRYRLSKKKNEPPVPKKTTEEHLKDATAAMEDISLIAKGMFDDRKK